MSLSAKITVTHNKNELEFFFQNVTLIIYEGHEIVEKKK